MTPEQLAEDFFADLAMTREYQTMYGKEISTTSFVAGMSAANQWTEVTPESMPPFDTGIISLSKAGKISHGVFREISSKWFLNTQAFWMPEPEKPIKKKGE